MMIKINWKLWIIYLCIAGLLGLAISACSSSKKNVSINKSHVDSSVVETKINNHTAVTDSTTKKTANEIYHKKTVNHYEPVEVDSGYDILKEINSGLIVKDKKTGKQTVYLPATTITEWGKIAKVDSTHVLKNDSSAVNEQKNTKLIADKKTVQKQKEKKGFNFLWLLLLIPVPLLFKKVRVIIFKFLFP